MLTKIVAVVMLTGSLVVAGDAAYQKFGCPLAYFSCAHRQSKCHSTESQSTETQAPSCCSQKSTSCCEDE